MKKFLTCILFALSAATTYAQQPQKRVALVIGVQNYVNVPPLRHSLNDANDMSVALKSKGFQVDFLKDPKSKKEIKDAITRYYNTMRGQNGAVGIIYYAGHGTQYEGENYLIPASANLQVPGDMDEQCVKMNTVMSVLTSSNNNLNILLLDACRTNTFPSFSRDIVKGLTNVEAPTGSIVVFATQPGTVASDGTGSNGLFTSKLLKYINEPGLNIGDVLKKVKKDVNVESQGKQTPSVVDNSIGGDFYFTKGGTSTQIPTSPPVVNSEIANSSVFDYGYGPSDAATITVGSQVWISKNLNVDHFANGDPIPEAKTDEEWKRAAENHTPAWCYYDNDPANGPKFGKLYNWYAVSDPRGLAPNGWHVPTDKEWTSLTTLFGGDPSAGGAMKASYGWVAVMRALNLPTENGNGSNSSGFTGLPGGHRGNQDGIFSSIGEDGHWWTSSEDGTSLAGDCHISFTSSYLVHDNFAMGNGFSVRCVRD